MASSGGEQTMNITEVYGGAPGSNWDDEAEDSQEEMDMENTEDITAEILRRQSLGGANLPSNLPPSTNPEVSYYSDGSMSMTQGGDEVEEQFVPLKRRPSRPPAHEDPNWLAMRAATSSGTDPYVAPPMSDDSSLDDMSGAMDDEDDEGPRNHHHHRRSSLPAPNPFDEEDPMDDNTVLSRHAPRPSLPAPNPFDEEDDDSMSSAGGHFSFNADETINLTQILGRPLARSSLAPSEMDLTQILHAEAEEEQHMLSPLPAAAVSPIPIPVAPIPPQPQSNIQLPPAPSPQKPPPVFSKPTNTKPVPFTFTTRPPSPSKLPAPSSPSKPKQTFSAAFAPPVARPSPKKTASTENLLKRPHTPQDSPSKRRAETGIAEAPTPTLEGPKKASSSLRRPSGYHARRRSMAPGGAEEPAQGNLKKEGRVSLAASGSQNAWSRFDRNEPLPQASGPSSAGASSAKVPTPSPVRTPPKQVIEFRSEEERDSQSVMEISMDDEDDAQDTTSGSSQEVTPLSSQETTSSGWGAESPQDEAGFDPNDEGPAVSITQFFELTGIRFMDEITAPRRSSIHPSTTQHRRSSFGTADVPLSAYFSSLAVDLPQLTLYNRVSQELQEWIEKSKEDFAADDEDALQVTPELFREYAMADEEGRRELFNHLTLIRHNMRGKARAEWYEWKLKWISGLRQTAEEHIQLLESDAEILHDYNTRADALIPERERECAAVKLQLEQDQAEVDEVEKDDQEYLNDLKVSIAEQNIEVDTLKGEVADANAQLQWIEEKLKQLELENTQLEAQAKEHKRVQNLQESGKGSEIFKLQTELEALQTLHQLRIVKVKPDLFQFDYASTVRISIPCNDLVPRASEIAWRRLDFSSRGKTKDAFPALGDHLVEATIKHVSQTKSETLGQVVRSVITHWSSCAQVRSQIRFLNAKFPTTVETKERSGDFEATALVIFPSVKGSAQISFEFTKEIVVMWPSSIGELGCSVKSVRGPVSQAKIAERVLGRLREATPTENQEVLLDACLHAMELFDAV